MVRSGNPATRFHHPAPEVPVDADPGEQVDPSGAGWSIRLCRNEDRKASRLSSNLSIQAASSGRPRRPRETRGAPRSCRAGIVPLPFGSQRSVGVRWTVASWLNRVTPILFSANGESTGTGGPARRATLRLTGRRPVSCCRGCRRGARHQRQLAMDALFTGAEQQVAPVDRRPQRAVMVRPAAAERLQCAGVETDLVGNFGQAEGAMPCGGELDGQGQSVDRYADLLDEGKLVGLAGIGARPGWQPVQEQFDRRTAQFASHIGAWWVRARKGEWLQLVFLLRRQEQRFAAGDQDRQLRFGQHVVRSSAVASRTCSALSTTSSILRRWVKLRTASCTDPVGGIATCKLEANIPSTCSGPLAPVRSTNQIPSTNVSARSRASRRQRWSCRSPQRRPQW